MAEPKIPEHWSYESVFDAGDGGCGQVIAKLRRHFEPLAAGARVLVINGDPGAPVEMPSWCRLTGHRLVESEPPCFLIAKREQPGS